MWTRNEIKKAIETYGSKYVYFKSGKRYETTINSGKKRRRRCYKRNSKIQ